MIYTLLYDDIFLNYVRMRYKDPLKAFVFHLLVTKAPCDHCSRMIVAKRAELNKRFGRAVELVVYAQSAYEGGQTCVGLEGISKDHQDWLTFRPLWKAV